MAATEESKAKIETGTPWIAKLLNWFRHPTRYRITPEMRANFNAPAQLFIWRENGETDDSQTFDSLREAIAAAPENPDSRTFIIAENGHIFRPLQISKIKQALKTMK